MSDATSTLKMIFRTIKQGDGEKQTASGISNLGTKFKDLTGLNIGAAAAIGATVAALKFSVGQAMEAERVDAQLNAVLKSTKNAAGLTADELDNMANSLSKMSAVEDETIKQAEAVMLTFTKIGKDTFPGAMEAALNMSAALGQDLQSSVVMLGKALNDPIQGMSALRRVGVSFSDAQVEMVEKLVESNQLLEAQALILGELETEFGGAAKAAGDTTAGSFDKLKNSVGNLGEAFGKELLVALKPVADEFTEIVNAAIELITFSERAEKTINAEASAANAANMTYQEYIANLQAVAREQGYTIQVTGNMVRVLNSGGMEVGYMFDILTEKEHFLETTLLSSSLAADEQAQIMGDLAGSTGDAAAAQDTLNASVLTASGVMQTYSTRLLFNKAAEGLSEEAALKLAMTLGLVDDQMVAATLGVEGLTEKYDLNKNGAIDAGLETTLYAGAVAALREQIEGLEDKTIDVTLNIHTTGVSNGSDWIRVVEGAGAVGHASGGVIGPGEIGTVGEQGWEYIQGLPGGGARVFSNSQSTKMNRGGDVYLTQNIYPTPGMDANALMKAATMQANAMRRARMRAGGGDSE